MIKETLQDQIATTLNELYDARISRETILLESTRRDFSGDYTLVVFPFLKSSRKSPEATAKEIGDRLLEKMELLESFQVVKGFLNLKISDRFWVEFMFRECFNHSYGTRPLNDSDPVIVEYSSPNTNKPLHLGHIRNNLLGFSVSQILMANGYRVVRVNLVNDRGIHICKSMLAHRKWGQGETPTTSGIKGDHLVGRYYVLFDKHYRQEVAELKSGGMQEEQALRMAPSILEAQEMLRKWEDGDPEIRELWAMMNDWVYQGFEKTYDSLGIAFEKTYYESQTYHLGKSIVLKGLQDGHLSRKEDGSIWADLRSDGLDEKVLLRADGTSVYMTQDLGTACQRYEEYHPAKMIYVVGNEQNYHFEVLKKVLSRLDFGFAGTLYHLSYGMVELPHGKMKSREGTVVDADDLVEEMITTAARMTRDLGKAGDLNDHDADDLFRMVGLGALKYFILKVDPKKNMLFDPAESIDFNGNTGPFIQYTHARIQSLLRKAEAAGNPEFPLDQVLNSIEKQEHQLLPVERNLIRLLYQYPDMVREAGDALSPALIANFIYDLAKEYNQFYQEVPVLKEENPGLVRIRLAVSQFTGNVIRAGMTLLGISVPERM